MTDILQLETVEQLDFIIDDTIDDTDMFPEKLAEARAWFDKHGLPKGWEKKTAAKSQQSVCAYELIEVKID